MLRVLAAGVGLSSPEAREGCKWVGQERMGLQVEAGGLALWRVCQLATGGAECGAICASDTSLLLCLLVPHVKC